MLEGSVPRREENEQALLDLEGELELRRTLQDTLTHLAEMARRPAFVRSFFRHPSVAYIAAC